MSDDQRNNVFAEFLRRQIPQSPSNVLDVACGDGRLCVALSKIFPTANVVGIDLKPRGNKRRIKVLKGRFPDRIKNIGEYDLFVGMHPDDATWPIVQESCKRKILFAVVPCCVLHAPSAFDGGDMYKWVQYISHYATNNGMRVVNQVLRMRGANHVILGIPETNRR